ncbi:hypothetical protein Tdes44962_MAKER00822 [Teratosphaeria destructans]|uniref:C2H2-type domain-containing protein n=1 Tax=Teratosphaeria destructans TaxID=418781 RepID=A0A9W7VZF6_9PEZI|nr:hypothetical protein Tdes44962_MAKER00822 [Teratosphaeria destructans]
MDQNYIPPMRIAHPTATSAPTTYPSTLSSSPSLYQSKSVPEVPAIGRRLGELPSVSSAETAYDQSYRRMANPYDLPQSASYSLASGQTIPSISGLTQSPLPFPHLVGSPNPSSLSQYNTNASRLPSMYDSGSYPSPFSSATPAQSQLYPPTQSASHPTPFVGSNVNDVLTKPLGGDSSIRVLNQRPKPQCWDHGCNGRQFSTFSNLLRHQREKSGSAAKSYCPKCGAEFTRTTARNGHLAHDKCSKQRKQSEEKQ